MLRPGGRLVVLDADWDSIVWHSQDPERMRRVLVAWTERLAHADLPRRLTGLLEDGGFTIAERSVLTTLNAGHDPDTYSAGLIPMIAAFVPGRAGVTEPEARAWADELRGLGSHPFFSLCR